MDNALKDLMLKASSRGSNYLKGETTLKELPDKMAELGVFLLERAKILTTLHDEELKGELIEIQNKLDDMRKAVFAGKIHIK